ncbi:GNAT family N-acetyltransferase [Neobacillus piezotolerans]|uniref:GNAT family N-acetyltransferase n=1 Tax=Neobacillus piezotolerans TaxID=2259171 RepID=A0A3D8GKP2_9BACI|nr:GNAT family N-acetyltransferase [Neobacillus piezotolerans]RDU34978.1 GNAT family N-acetyltransferase [Neobacillus piezotolerans]
MIRPIDITNENEALDVLRIQLPSYQVEAELIDFYGIPALNDTAETLMKSGETFYGYYENGSLCGAISFKKENGTIDIHRLMVHPDHFRKGIARQLLHSLVQNNREEKRLIVSTGANNTPAVRFYEQSGFQKTAEDIIAGTLAIARFEKQGTDRMEEGDEDRND